MSNGDSAADVATDLGRYLIRPEWDLPDGVNAVVTTTRGGDFSSPFGGFNLAAHVGDEPANVERNRAQLQQFLKLPQQPLWLNQVHGVDVAEVGADTSGVSADASVSRTSGAAAAVLTADCLPVLFFSQKPQLLVAAAHAGWRGLVAGVLEETLKAMGCAPGDVSCWLGPAIGPAAFEVGAEVRAAFVAKQASSASAFVATGQQKYLANLAALARLRLQAAGVKTIVSSNLCSVSDSRFYSYRRSGQDISGAPVPSGRMASLIWFD